MAVINILVGLAILIGVLWLINDVWSKNKSLSKNMKIAWTVLAVFFNVITVIVYYFMHKK